MTPQPDKEREDRYTDAITNAWQRGDSDVRAVMAVADAEQAANVARIRKLEDDKATFERWRDQWIATTEAQETKLARAEDRAEKAEAALAAMGTLLREAHDALTRGTETPAAPEEDEVDLLDDPVAGRCIACNRATWDISHLGHECLMTQPDGHLCPGVFEAAPKGGA